MANIMWLGGDGEPDTCEWRGITFKKGEPVNVDDAFVIKKASTNPHFVVDGEAAKQQQAADRMAAARAAKAAKQQA